MEIRIDLDGAIKRVNEYYAAGDVRAWEAMISEEDNLLVFLTLLTEAARYDLFHNEEFAALAEFILDSCSEIISEIGLGRPGEEPTEEEPPAEDLFEDDSPAIRAYDNLGTFERYLVVLDLDAVPAEEQGCRRALFMSENPDAYDGTTEWADVVVGHHLGREVPFDELPEEIRSHFSRRLSELTS